MHTNKRLAGMEKYINEFNKECYRGVLIDDDFSNDLFHHPEHQYEGDDQVAMHTNLGTITVLDRMTGFGWRDVETGFRDPAGAFWLASGGFDIRCQDVKTFRQAIDLVKQNANTCIDC